MSHPFRTFIRGGELFKHPIEKVGPSYRACPACMVPRWSETFCDRHGFWRSGNGRFLPIIGLDSDIKALLRLPELVCVSPAVFPGAWYTWPRFVGLESSENTDFGRQIDSNQLKIEIMSYKLVLHTRTKIQRKEQTLNMREPRSVSRQDEVSPGRILKINA